MLSIPVVHLDLRISSRIFEKNRNDPNVIDKQRRHFAFLSIKEFRHIVCNPVDRLPADNTQSPCKISHCNFCVSILSWFSRSLSAFACKISATEVTVQTFPLPEMVFIHLIFLLLMKMNHCMVKKKSTVSKQEPHNCGMDVWYMGLVTDQLEKRTEELYGNLLKILSSQRRGGSRGLPIDLSCLPTQSLIFFWKCKGILLCFKFENRFQHLGGKKCGVFFDVESATKTQRHVKMLCHSPSDDTPNAATVAVMTCGVSLLSSKNIVFCFHTPHCGPRPKRYSTCRYSYGGGIGSFVTWLLPLIKYRT